MVEMDPRMFFLVMLRERGFLSRRPRLREHALTTGAPVERCGRDDQRTLPSPWNHVTLPLHIEGK